jgi:pilus assembly protein CpaE
MAIVSVVGAKGGVGATLVATNLAAALAQAGSCLVVDLHVTCPAADLLLDLQSTRSWLDLLPVADELTPRHLELSLVGVAGGPSLLGAPAIAPATVDPGTMRRLVGALDRRFDWVVVDVPPGPHPVSLGAAGISQMCLLVVTIDPPALRGAHRVLTALPPASGPKTALVVNQATPHHPAHPEELVSALDCSILGILPRDPEAVGRQVHFGQPVVAAADSSLGRGLRGLAQALAETVGPGKARDEHSGQPVSVVP